MGKRTSKLLNVAVFLDGDGVDRVPGSGIASELFEAVIEDQYALTPPDSVANDLHPRLMPGELVWCAKPWQARHHVWIGPNVVVWIERAEVSGFLGVLASQACPCPLMPGPPRGQMVADVASSRVAELRSRVQIESCPFVFDFLGDSEDFEDIELRIHVACSRKVRRQRCRTIV